VSEFVGAVTGASFCRWWGCGQAIVVVPDKREELPGDLIGNATGSRFLPPLEDIPVDVLLQTQRKAPHEGPLMVAEGYFLLPWGN